MLCGYAAMVFKCSFVTFPSGKTIIEFISDSLSRFEWENTSSGFEIEFITLYRLIWIANLNNSLIDRVNMKTALLSFPSLPYSTTLCYTKTTLCYATLRYNDSFCCDFFIFQKTNVSKKKSKREKESGDIGMWNISSLFFASFFFFFLFHFVEQVTFEIYRNIVRKRDCEGKHNAICTIQTVNWCSVGEFQFVWSNGNRES